MGECSQPAPSPVSRRRSRPVIRPSIHFAVLRQALSGCRFTLSGTFPGSHGNFEPLLGSAVEAQKPRSLLGLRLPKRHSSATFNPAVKGKTKIWMNDNGNNTGGAVESTIGYCLCSAKPFTNLRNVGNRSNEITQKRIGFTLELFF